MSESLIEQARTLYRTINKLKARTLIANAQKNVGMNCSAKDLTLPQWSTLAVIRDQGEMSVKEIAEATHVSAPSASAMVDRLVEFGVVTREPSQVDRREVRVFLSPQGEDAVNEMESQILQSIVDLLEKLGPDASRQWCDIYSRIETIVDQEEIERREERMRDRQRSNAV